MPENIELDNIEVVTYLILNTQKKPFDNPKKGIKKGCFFIDR